MNSEVLIKFKADDKEVDEATKSASSKLSSFASGAAKAFAGATTVAVAAVSSMVKSAVSEFAEYEQALGGVFTLFGTGEAKTVEEYAAQVGKSVKEVEKEFHELATAEETVTVNAAQAYKTAGLSMNDYMNTVNGFAAALKQSIKDPVALAEAADEAVIDMSDNANKMGTSMEAIQNAYSGFAKQNYTMLDNLKLGYGGTKTEMERLLADASKLSGQKYDIKNLKDVYKAIHVIQEEMGITGTTAKEASSTISGSLNQTKAAYRNLLSDIIADDGVFAEESLNNLLESATTFLGNLLPVIQTALTSIANMIPTLVQKIIPMLPEMAKKILPPLISSAVSIVQGLIQAVPTLVETILPSLLDGVVQITKEIIKILPDLIIMIADMLPEIIPDIVDAIMEIIPMLLENIPRFVEAGFKLILGLLKGIINCIPQLLGKIKELGSNLVGKVREVFNLETLVNVGKNLVQGLWNGIKSVKDWILDKIKGFCDSITGGLKSFFGIHSPSKVMADQIGQYLPKGIAVGIEANADSVNGAMEDIQKDITSSFGINSQMAGAMQNSASRPIINVYNNMEVDPIGQVVSRIKTFSGGAKNDYNYGQGVS